MRSRAPLALMEQMVMLLVFALAAALCLQAFVRSEAMSRESEARDRAAVQCQNAAEAVRHAGGDLEKAAETLGIARDQEEPALSAYYSGDWSPCGAQDWAYRLTVRPVESGVRGLGKASVRVSAADGSAVFELEIAWQEGELDG